MAYEKLVPQIEIDVDEDGSYSLVLKNEVNSVRISRGQDVASGVLRAALPSQATFTFLDKDGDWSYFNPSFNNVAIGTRVRLKFGTTTTTGSTISDPAYIEYVDDNIAWGSDVIQWGNITIGGGSQKNDPTQFLQWGGLVDKIFVETFGGPDSPQRLVEVYCIGNMRRLVGGSAMLTGSSMNSITAINSILDTYNIAADDRNIAATTHGSTVSYGSGTDIANPQAALAFIQQLCAATVPPLNLYESRTGRISVQPAPSSPTVVSLPHGAVRETRGRRPRVYTVFNAVLARVSGTDSPYSTQGETGSYTMDEWLQNTNAQSNYPVNYSPSGVYNNQGYWTFRYDTYKGGTLQLRTFNKGGDLAPSWMEFIIRVPDTLPVVSTLQPEVGKQLIVNVGDAVPDADIAHLDMPGGITAAVTAIDGQDVTIRVTNSNTTDGTIYTLYTANTSNTLSVYNTVDRACNWNPDVTDSNIADTATYTFTSSALQAIYGSSVYPYSPTFYQVGGSLTDTGAGSARAQATAWKDDLLVSSGGAAAPVWDTQVVGFTGEDLVKVRNLELFDEIPLNLFNGVTNGVVKSLDLAWSQESPGLGIINVGLAPQ